jgi:hypothetical protein
MSGISRHCPTVAILGPGPAEPSVPLAQPRHDPLRRSGSTRSPEALTTYICRLYVHRGTFHDKFGESNAGHIYQIPERPF